MTVRRLATRSTLAVAGILLATAAYAHPGHGAPEGHIHGLFEALVLIGAVAVSIWIARKR